MEIHRFVTSINFLYAIVEFIVFFCLILCPYLTFSSLSFFFKYSKILKEVALY